MKYEFQDGTKHSKPKNKQKKVKYNLDNLLNDDLFPNFVIRDDPFEKRMEKINRISKEIEAMNNEISNRFNNLIF